MISTVDHRRTPLLDALYTQTQTPHHRFYMPGHKGGKGSPASILKAVGGRCLSADIPELPNLDQLFAPTSVIQDAQTLAADAFGAERSYFLINGSSTGLMAAIMTICQPGDKIILPRNCHQSIVHGLILSGAHPVWIYPPLEQDSYIPHCITPQQLQAALKICPEAKGAIAVSPSYEGVCGNIQSLAAIAHRHHIPLIVDEAHGAHFAFHPDLPPSALSQGADLVVQSTHKVLGALTQASMLHVNSDRISQTKLQQNLTILQSSSPNYLLLASLDAARAQMAIHGEQILGAAIKIAAIARQRIRTIPSFRILGPQTQTIPPIDPLRLTLITTHSDLSGFELDEFLNQGHRILAELPAERYLCFVLGQGNSHNDIETLCNALESIAAQYPQRQPQHTLPLHPSPFDQNQPSTSITIPLHSPRDVHYTQARTVAIEDAIGAISHDLICPYPPGIPLICPGEIITPEQVQTLQTILRLGGKIIGPRNPTLESLEIVRES